MEYPRLGDTFMNALFQTGRRLAMLEYLRRAALTAADGGTGHDWTVNSRERSPPGSVAFFSPLPAGTHLVDLPPSPAAGTTGHT